MKIDATDIKIINSLKKNGKDSYRELSKKLLMPLTTIHNRIRKLESNGIIKGYSIILNNKKLGKDLAAYILIKADYNSLKHTGTTQQQLAEKIKNSLNAEDVALITGFRDIIIKVRCFNIDELNTLITKELRTIQGIKSTETLVILEEIE